MELGTEGGGRARKDKGPCISVVKWNRVFNSQSEFFIVNKHFIYQIASAVLKALERDAVPNSKCQHKCFITQSNYIGYMFLLLISYLQAYFNRFSNKMLCTHWDPSVFTSILTYSTVQSPS